MQPTGYVNGVITPLNEAKVPILDRGFLYGDSVYEVFRTYDGIAFLFDEHYVRLCNSANLMGMTIPFDAKHLEVEIKKAIEYAQPEKHEDVYVRYQITRGEGVIDLDPGKAENPCLIIMVKHVPQWPQHFYDQGMAIAVANTRRNAVNSLDPNIKGGNYLNNILGLSEARRLGADDCVMLDRAGNISECSNSNIWFVIDDEVVTPLGENLTGLTRKSLVALLQDNNVAVAERALTIEDVKNASECFITSATREVMPCASLRIDAHTMMTFADGGGPKTRQCMQLYKNMIVKFIETNQHQKWW